MVESTDSEDLEKRLLSCYEEWGSLDIDRLAPYYSKDPRIVIFNDVGPAMHQGWKEFSEAERKIVAGVVKWTVEPNEVRVSVWGEVGLTTATPVLTVDNKAGKHYDVTIRHTVVWNREGGSWLIKHEHWSIPWRSS